VRVFELAKKLNVNSKRILEVAEILGINVKTHQSSLSEEDVSKIIKYLKKNKRIGIVFNKTALTLIDAIKKGFKKRTFVTGLLFGLTAFTIYGFSSSNANDIVAEVEIIDTVEQIDVLTTTPVELIDQDISSPPLFTDAVDATTTTVLPTTTTTVPVTTTTTVLPTTTTTVPVTTTTTVLPTTTTTVPVTTTTTVLPTTTTTVLSTTTTTVPVTCNDESFQPYTLYTISGKANTVMSCRNEQDALESGYVFTVNPAPPPPPTTTTTTIPVSTNYTFEQNYYHEDESGSAIDIDSSNNLYVAGTYYRPNTTIGSQTLTNYGADDIFVYKLNHLGDLEWLKTFGNSSDSFVYDIAVDQSGNTIVTGYFIGSLDFGTGTQTATGGGSTFILKLDQNGDTDWVVTSTSGQRFDYGFGVDTDSTGNIYIAGSMQQKTTNTSTSITFGTFTLSSVNAERTFYMKINPSGDVQWLKTVTGSHTEGYRVFIDSQDNKYLTGSCKRYNVSTFSNVDGSESTTLSCSTTSDDVLIIKLDSSDNYVWHWNDNAYLSSSRDIIVNSSGDVFATYYVQYNQTEICGTSIDAGTENYYYVLLKLDSTGTCQWFYRNDRSTNDRNFVLHLGLDSSDNIYFLNQYTESGLITQFISVFNDQGVQQNSLNTSGFDFVFDSDDNIYLFQTPQTIKRSLSDIE
jgi:hypothetical protein